MKAKGLEIATFCTEWPMGDDWFVEEGLIADDPFSELEPSVSYDVEEVLGVICWQGLEDPPTHLTVNGTQVKIDSYNKTISALKVFKAWRGDCKTYSVLLSPEDAIKFKALCAEAGWKVKG